MRWHAVGERPGAGLSLVEVLIASLIMATALAAIFQTMGLSVKGTERIEEEILATNIAQDLLDFLSGLPYHSLPAASARRPVVDVELPALPAAFDGAEPKVQTAVRQKIKTLHLPQHFEAFVSMEQVSEESRGGSAGAAGPAGNLRKVTVQVRWTSALAPGRQVSRKVVLACLVTDDQDLAP